jgi:hypothetical protein
MAMESDEGKELERLIAVGDYAAARQLTDSVLSPVPAKHGTEPYRTSEVLPTDKAKEEAKKLRRAFHADPMAIVLVAVTAIGLLVSFFSYSGVP